ncbi:hypothetical protein [Streptomyces sp. 2A115]|uniref:hypothetical protein n=1 Tax=Streptomyces sp. 2A115 TaxID=3457439 RepID=UPI003FD2BB98
MTSSTPRSRSRRAASHAAARVVRAAAGAVVALGLLVMAVAGVQGAVAWAGELTPMSASAVTSAGGEPDGGETYTADLVLPLVAAGGAGALAAYGYVRRKRRARSRTTPGGDGPRLRRRAGGGR